MNRPALCIAVKKDHKVEYALIENLLAEEISTHCDEFQSQLFFPNFFEFWKQVSNKCMNRFWVNDIEFGAAVMKEAAVLGVPKPEIFHIQSVDELRRFTTDKVLPIPGVYCSTVKEALCELTVRMRAFRPAT